MEKQKTKTKSKKIFILAVVLVLFFTQSLMAEVKIEKELSLGILKLYGVDVDEEDPTTFPIISLRGAIKGIGLEGSYIIFGNGYAGLMGKLVFSTPYLSSISVFTAGGASLVLSGGFALNFGGGIKVRLNDKIAFRTEYLHWMIPGEEWFDFGTIGAGISFFF